MVSRTLLMSRSLKASTEGIKRAKLALEYKGWSQLYLVNSRGIASWSTVNGFFNGKSVDRDIFLQICEELNLSWEDIAELPEAKPNEAPILDKWQELTALGSPTEQMGLVLVQEETLTWGTKLPSPYKKSVRLGSFIRFEVNFDFSGYLILLQKDTQGQMLCFCPSCFASEPLLSTGKTILPQSGAPMTSFPIEGEPGDEQIIAVVTKEMPALDWLPKINDDPLQLDDTHLQSLLDYLGKCEEGKVLYTQYSIVA